MDANESAAGTSLRQRRRVRDMKAVQQEAVALFADEGFDEVSVERIASAAGVSPVSIYRWFGTKESVVLWDDYDPPLLEAIHAHLATSGPLEAVRDGVADELDDVYDRDRALVLARSRLVHHEPALLAASTHGMRAMELALAELFAATGHGSHEVQRRTWAVVAVAVLRAAVDTWQRQDGREQLATIVVAAFDAVEDVPWTR